MEIQESYFKICPIVFGHTPVEFVDDPINGIGRPSFLCKVCRFKFISDESILLKQVHDICDQLLAFEIQFHFLELKLLYQFIFFSARYSSVEGSCWPAL